MLRPGKEATPATAATVFVPASVPPLGLVPIATATFPVNPVAVLPLASWAVTSTAGVIAAPAVVPLGCTEHTSWVSVPASVPPLGLVPIASVMFPVNPVAVLPLASWAVTSTAGVIAAPAVVLLGCTENAS